MSVGPILTLGIGAFTGGGVQYIPTLGYGTGGTPPPPPPIIPSGGGGGTFSRKINYPKYYRDLKIDESGPVALPQDEIANKVAISVLEQLDEIWAALDAEDGRFDEMLEEVKHCERQVATYIESRQIYNLVQQVETRIYLERVRLADEAEEAEAMELLF